MFIITVCTNRGELLSCRLYNRDDETDALNAYEQAKVENTRGTTITIQNIATGESMAVASGQKTDQWPRCSCGALATRHIPDIDEYMCDHEYSGWTIACGEDAMDSVYLGQPAEVV